MRRRKLMETMEAKERITMDPSHWGKLVSWQVPIGLVCCITALLYYKDHEA